MDAVVVAWRMAKYACKKSSTDQNEKCPCGIGCTAALHTGWKKAPLPAAQAKGGGRKGRGSAAAAAASAPKYELGHMWEHALQHDRVRRHQVPAAAEAEGPAAPRVRRS